MHPRFHAIARRFLLADTPPLSPAERLRSALGALVGIAICAIALHAMPVGSHWILAPLGASAVLLFALPHAPLARPWSVLGGYLVSALAALTSAAWIPMPELSAAVAVAASIWLMARFNCLHPAGGALALFIVLEGPPSIAQAGSTLLLVLLNVAALLLAAMLVNNLILRRGYPLAIRPGKSNLHATRDASPSARLDIDHEDLASAVKTLDTFVDVQEEELVQLYRLAVEHAFDRHIGLTCGDIMSRDVVSVLFGTELEEAWTLLRAHKIKALPVVDNFGRLIGILTAADFLRQLDDTTAAGLAVRLQGLLRRTPGPNSEKAEVVGQIMTENVTSARLNTPISELVSQLSDRSMHHVPVLDDTGHVLGMVTQSDLIAALYRRISLSVV
ncbi:MAG: HPP family protein [Thiobacillus sp.]|nr:HPP family protein [Thiobacillus sp.]